jgi:eukaryotic-like serine/threonine-protein kinase
MSKIRLANVPVYALIFGNLFFASAIIFSQIVLRGETVAVPDLTGKTVPEAKALLTKKDLLVVQRGTDYSDAWDRGRIVRQDPVSGSKIRVMKTISVVISSGSRDVQVPSLEGKAMEVALPALKEAGLYKGMVSQIHTPRAAAGRILAQNPPVQEEVGRGSAVGLLVSQGDWEDRYVMPDLIGKRADRMIARLKDLDFKIGDIRYSYYPGLGKGIIIKQFPLDGYKVQKRNLITLEVSR